MNLQQIPSSVNFLKRNETKCVTLFNGVRKIAKTWKSPTFFFKKGWRYQIFIIEVQQSSFGHLLRPFKFQGKKWITDYLMLWWKWHFVTKWPRRVPISYLLQQFEIRRKRVSFLMNHVVFEKYKNVYPFPWNLFVVE